MTKHAVSLGVTPYLRIECKFWLGVDGWNCSCEHPAISVQAGSFEQAKADMEIALGKYFESVLRTSKPAAKEQAAYTNARLASIGGCKILIAGPTFEKD